MTLSRKERLLHVLVRARALSARVLVFVHLLAARLLLCISLSHPHSPFALYPLLSLSLSRARPRVLALTQHPCR